AAGDRPRRAYRRGRRRASPGAVALRAPAQPGRPHHRSHHPLPGGGGSPVRAHRHAQAGARGGARHHGQPRQARPPPVSPPAPARGPSRRSARARARQHGGRACPSPQELRRRRPGARVAAPRRLPHRGNGADAARPRGRVRRRDAPLMSGFPTLLYKEVLRFWKVSTQTIGAPVLTAALFLFIFGHVLEGRVRMYESVSYTAFLVPGLVMMALLQHAFANSSSSLIQSKITGNIIFVLLPPL